MTSGAHTTRKNPLALEKVAARLKQLASREIAVGFPRGKAQAYPDGTSVVEVAARHVFGEGVPQRDFMALAKPGIAEKTRPILRAIAAAETPGEVTALQNAAGLAAQAQIQTAIVELDSPPNSPATIAAKKSSNPLIDTGHMKDSVTFVVRERR